MAKAPPCRQTLISALKINISALKATIPITEASRIQLTIEEHFERDKPLIKCKFTSLDYTISAYFLETPCR